MTPALARIKRHLRAAIAANGGIEGAAATVGRGHSVVGEWNNLNRPVFPAIDHALALDEVALATGRRAEILHGLAAELGHVCLRLPEVAGSAGEIGMAMISASAEFGEVAGTLRDATEDGRIDPAERDGLCLQIDEAVAALAKMRALVTALTGDR